MIDQYLNQIEEARMAVLNYFNFNLGFADLSWHDKLDHYWMVIHYPDRPVEIILSAEPFEDIYNQADYFDPYWPSQIFEAKDYVAFVAQQGFDDVPTLYFLKRALEETRPEMITSYKELW